MIAGLLASYPAYAARLRYEVWSRFNQIVGRIVTRGKKGSVGRQVRILGSLKLHLGDRVALRDNVILGGHGKITIGRDTAINAGCIITALESVEIGSNVLFASRVCVLDVDHRFDQRDAPIAAQGYVIRPVVIENDVWVGTGAVIVKGVRIGKGAIVGANSVVTRDVTAYTIVAGVPAKVLRERPE